MPHSRYNNSTYACSPVRKLHTTPTIHPALPSGGFFMDHVVFPVPPGEGNKLNRLNKQCIHGYNSLDTVAIHVHLKAISGNQRRLDIFLVLGGGQKRLNLIP